MNLQEVFIKRMADHLKVVKSMKWHQNIVVDKWLFWKKIVKRSFLFIKFVNIEHTSTLNQLTNKDIGFKQLYSIRITADFYGVMSYIQEVKVKKRQQNVHICFVCLSFKIECCSSFHRKWFWIMQTHFFTNSICFN